jgi:hypothetical protein
MGPRGFSPGAREEGLTLRRAIMQPCEPISRSRQLRGSLLSRFDNGRGRSDPLGRRSALQQLPQPDGEGSRRRSRQASSWRLPHLERSVMRGRSASVYGERVKGFTATGSAGIATRDSRPPELATSPDGSDFHHLVSGDRRHAYSVQFEIFRPRAPLESRIGCAEFEFGGVTIMHPLLESREWRNSIGLTYIGLSDWIGGRWSGGG